MVANAIPVADRFATLPEPFLTGRWLVPRFTRGDVAALLHLGIIPEDASTELLEGLIVLKDRSATGQGPAMIGNEHRKCVERFSELRAAINTPARHVETQQPLICSETHVPEPDFMVLQGQLADYSDLPAAADAYCVVEVADSSYERDVGPKLRSYARAGVLQYVIVNLRNRTAEVYANPDAAAGTYPSATIVRESDALGLRVGVDEQFEVRLSDILP
jgi:hypothetical protein